MEEYRVFIVGKTGNGKSSLGNTILGRQEFPVASSMASETRRVFQGVGSRGGERLRVIDTPDAVNRDLSDTAMKDEVARWKSLAAGRFAILLAVRCDVRYTAEEYDIYRKIKAAWGDKSFRDHLVVVFTFGDRQDGNIGQELKSVCWELRSVLADARDRYVVFNNRAHENEPQLRLLLHVLHDLERQPPPIPLYRLLFLFLITAVLFGLCWHFDMLKAFLFLTVVAVTAAFGFLLSHGRGVKHSDAFRHNLRT